MRISIFQSLFTSYLSSRIPCHPLYYDWSREHVIPRGLKLPRNITEHPRNLMPMPSRMNHQRGRKPYTAAYKDGYVAYACDNCPHPGLCAGASIISAEGVYPADPFKGVIARSVIYSAFQNPTYAHIIDKEVLDLETAIKWDSQYPMSKAEKEWIDSLT